MRPGSTKMFRLPLHKRKTLCRKLQQSTENGGPTNMRSRAVIPLTPFPLICPASICSISLLPVKKIYYVVIDIYLDKWDIALNQITQLQIWTCMFWIRHIVRLLWARPCLAILVQEARWKDVPSINKVYTQINLFFWHPIQTVASAMLTTPSTWHFKLRQMLCLPHPRPGTSNWEVPCFPHPRPGTGCENCLFTILTCLIYRVSTFVGSLQFLFPVCTNICRNYKKCIVFGRSTFQ